MNGETTLATKSSWIIWILLSLTLRRSNDRDIIVFHVSEMLCQPYSTAVAMYVNDLKGFCCQQKSVSKSNDRRSGKWSRNSFRWLTSVVNQSKGVEQLWFGTNPRMIPLNPNCLCIAEKRCWAIAAAPGVWGKILVVLSNIISLHYPSMYLSLPILLPVLLSLGWLKTSVGMSIINV